MVLTDLIPAGGKNLQLNCTEIGGSSRFSVLYVVSELCSNIYLPPCWVFTSKQFSCNLCL